MNRFSYLKDVVSLSLENDRCVGCGMCGTVCPHRVFTMEEGKAGIADRDACMECGACALNCPTEAIQVRKGVGCAAAVINAALGRKVTGCSCSIDPEHADSRSLACGGSGLRAHACRQEESPPLA